MTSYSSIFNLYFPTEGNTPHHARPHREFQGLIEAEAEDRRPRPKLLLSKNGEHEHFGLIFKSSQVMYYEAGLWLFGPGPGML